MVAAAEKGPQQTIANSVGAPGGSPKRLGERKGLRCSGGPPGGAQTPKGQAKGAPGGPHVRFRDSCLTMALREVLVRGS